MKPPTTSVYPESRGGDPITITEFHLMSLVRYEWNLLGGVAATRGMVVAA